MFEKEAEEYLKKDGTKAEKILDMLNEISPLKITLKQVPFILAMIQQVFKDGAEFGYNKANEWHFVKDGDYPNTENLECLCIIRPGNEMLANKDFRGVLYFRSGRFYLDEDNCNDCFKETNSDFTDIVIAWKEIVLPER